MQFNFNHVNFNVLNLEKSVDFYRKALNLEEKRRIDIGDAVLVFMADGKTGFSLELTYLKSRENPYDLGEGEFHLCMEAEDYEAGYQHHKEMGCIVYENNKMGLYFISDPDGYWIEIIRARKK